MRKLFLLIILITGSAFLQDGLNTGSSRFAVKISDNKFIPQDVNSNQYVACDEHRISFSNQNLEDEDIKSKPVYTAGLSFETAILFIAATYLFKNELPFRRNFCRDLFKLNRALRL